MLTNIFEVHERNMNQWLEIARQVQLVSGVQTVNEDKAKSDAKTLYDMYTTVNIK